MDGKFRAVLLSLLLGSVAFGVFTFAGSLIPAVRPYVPDRLFFTFISSRRRNPAARNDAESVRNRLAFRDKLCYDRVRQSGSGDVPGGERSTAMKLAIGNDHVAVDMKLEIKAFLEEKGIEVIDVGTNERGSFNYPVSGYRVAKMVAAGEVDGGVLICGTGVGISLAANKVRGIRACVCSDPYTAKLSKQHNNTNIIAFGARVIGVELAKMIVEEWVNASFLGGRHQTRVDMIMEIEETQRLAAAEEN